MLVAIVRLGGPVFAPVNKSVCRFLPSQVSVLRAGCARNFLCSLIVCLFANWLQQIGSRDVYAPGRTEGQKPGRMRAAA